MYKISKYKHKRCIMGNVPVPTRGAFEFPGRYKLYPEACCTYAREPSGTVLSNGLYSEIIDTS